MARSIHLRSWQRAALDRLAVIEREEGRPDFLAVATPGAGKTTFALAAARQWLAESPAPLVVVVPTAHLKSQWARAAGALDLHLDATWSPAQGAMPPDMHGVVTTYQQVAVAPRAVRPVAHGAVVILDEIHHAGEDRVWGESLREAFGGARRRLSLSGTPFRSDTRSIPFIRYVDLEADPDFEYGYGPALAEHRVVRPVYFPRTNGFMEWAAPDGAIYGATFDDALDTARSNQRLRAALSLEGEWLPEVLRAAHDRLTQLRRHQPDAGGLVIATDQEHARGIAAIIRDRLRTRAVVATSDDPAASEKILGFSGSSEPWLVAVRMVSEGVDIPRLRVGVFATTTTTELFFRQAVGRLVRWQAGVGRQAAYLFIPDDHRLRTMAAAIAEDRRHSLVRRERAEEVDGDVRGDGVAPGESVQGSPPEEQLSFFSVISAVATDATLPVDDAFEPPESDEEDPALLLELPPPPPLRSGALSHPSSASGSPVQSRTEVKAALREQNAAIVRALVAQTGWTHARVNGELNRLVGLTRVTEATVAQLEQRLRHGERWFARR